MTRDKFAFCLFFPILGQILCVFVCFKIKERNLNVSSRYVARYISTCISCDYVSLRQRTAIICKTLNYKKHKIIVIGNSARYH